LPRDELRARRADVRRCEYRDVAVEARRQNLRDHVTSRKRRELTSIEVHGAREKLVDAARPRLRIEPSHEYEVQRDDQTRR
jgi:hypothetical protein